MYSLLKVPFLYPFYGLLYLILQRPDLGLRALSALEESEGERGRSERGLSRSLTALTPSEQTLLPPQKKKKKSLGAAPDHQPLHVALPEPRRALALEVLPRRLRVRDLDSSDPSSLRGPAGAPRCRRRRRHRRGPRGLGGEGGPSAGPAGLAALALLLLLGEGAPLVAPLGLSRARRGGALPVVHAVAQARARRPALPRVPARPPAALDRRHEGRRRGRAPPLAALERAAGLEEERARSASDRRRVLLQEAQSVGVPVFRGRRGRAWLRSPCVVAAGVRRDGRRGAVGRRPREGRSEPGAGASSGGASSGGACSGFLGGCCSSWWSGASPAAGGEAGRRRCCCCSFGVEAGTVS